jgi:hypothetical protein
MVSSSYKLKYNNGNIVRLLRLIHKTAGGSQN